MTAGHKILNRFWDWRLWIVIAAFAAPFADTFVRFGTPWPSMSAAVLGAVLAEMLAFALSWALVSRWYENTKRILCWLIVLGSVLCLAFAISYISLASRYVCQVYGSSDRYVVGSQYVSAMMEEFVTSDPSKYTPEELIGQYHNVESVWTQESLAQNRMALLISWCACWFGLGLIIANVVLAFRDQTERRHIVPIEPSALVEDVWHSAQRLRLDETASLDNGGTPQVEETPQEVILLIHGIRTQAEWQHMVADVLGQIPDASIWPLKYHFFDTLRFWFPLATRNRPIGKILWGIREAKRLYPAARLSVIAHSFGTYATVRVLKDNPDISLYRLVLCGSVLPCDFRWDQIGRQIEKDVINDCGAIDIWPVLAEWASWGYGASGTYGFGTPGIHDRFHNFKHSGFFRKSFITKFWLSWFQHNERTPGVLPRKRPYYWSLMTVLKIRWVLAALPFILAGWLWFVVF